MPRLKPSDQEESNRIVRACIAAGMERQALSNEQLATFLGITPTTVRRKRNNPQEFTLGELQKMAKKLKFTPFQVASMMLGRELTMKEIRDFILM